MTFSATADPGAVVRAVADGVSRIIAGGLTPAEHEAQLDALAGLYAESTDVRHPFAPPPRDRALRTRAQLRSHFAGGGPPSHVVERFEPVDPVVHRTEDPEVVVFEFGYAIRAAGRDSVVRAIFVVRVRDGEIVESRDYIDHAAMARALGEPPAGTRSRGDEFRLRARS
jgi:ketosteroid isomerase-like protein